MKHVSLSTLFQINFFIVLKIFCNKFYFLFFISNQIDLARSTPPPPSSIKQQVYPSNMVFTTSRNHSIPISHPSQIVAPPHAFGEPIIETVSTQRKKKNLILLNFILSCTKKNLFRSQCYRL